MVVTIVTTVLIATAGWTFGIIKGQAEKDLTRLEAKMDQTNELLQEILIAQEINKYEIKYLKEDMSQYQVEIKELNKKMGVFFNTYSISP